MRIQALLLVSITASFILSLIATLASYNVVSPSDPRILDAAWVNRGWPLHWMIESWSYWSPPPYTPHFTFEPVNFIIDLVFYAIILQTPMQLYMYFNRSQKTKSQATERL